MVNESAMLAIVMNRGAKHIGLVPGTQKTEVSAWTELG